MPKFDEVEDNRRRRRVARDGEVVRAPLFAMDALRAAVASASEARAVTTLDAAGHRPGFVTLADEDRAARQAMYDRYEAALVNRYRNPPALASDQTRDANPPARSPASPTDRAAAHAAYDRKISERWRGAA